MTRALRLTLAAGAATIAALWTLAAVGAGWMLLAGASALEGGSSAATLQAVAAWTERPWVRHWLDPHEADAVRDGADWLLGLGGGPAAWLGSALTLLGAALVMVWAGGLVLGALVGLAAMMLVQRWVEWWRNGPRWPSAARQAPVVPAEGHPMS